MFERYNEGARRALFHARYEASQLGSISIEPEHLLLGLLRLDPNVASPFIAQVPDIRSAVAARVQTKARISTSVEIPFSKPTKRALEGAAGESDRLRHSHIGPEHLLLALLADPSTIAGDLLTRNGLRLDAVREQIAARPAADRPGPLSTGANASPEFRRQAALRQIEAAVEFIKAFGEEHAQTDEARRLIEQICRDIESFERHLPKGES